MIQQLLDHFRKVIVILLVCLLVIVILNCFYVQKNN